MIKSFNLIHEDHSYERLRNPEQRSVYQLSPIGAEWRSTITGSKTVFWFQGKGTAVLLRGCRHVALVTYGPSSYGGVLSEEGDFIRRFDVSQSGEEFFDVYYVSEKLCFFKNQRGIDIRLEVSSEDFSIARLTKLKKY